MKKSILTIALAVSVNFTASAAQAFDWDNGWFSNTVSFMNQTAGAEGDDWSRTRIQDDSVAMRDVVTNHNTGAQTTFWYSGQTGAAAGAVISNNGVHEQYDACGKKMSEWSDNGYSQSFETDCAY